DPAWLASSAERQRAVDRIGNLTLVTGTFNRGVSNRGWSVKRPEFEKQKSLVINYDIAKSEVWDEDAIESRGRSLAAAAVRLWPAPYLLGAAGFGSSAQRQVR
ncbi:HNH endonuclease family protein, partial [Brachybacterium sp. AOP35-5H-19]|uniref:HNH endonuclease family protein n=1 Tax=Brachybacterium sp. AOP35-5H-19 TaxID=3457685 RepID=UPI0040349E7B